jgi:hypothetical protein
MLKVKATVITTVCLSLLGCGGGSSDPDTTNPIDSNNAVLTGVFVDSAVQGVSYSTATQSGTTNAQGQFNYMAGEQVTFSIGSTQLPAVAAAPQVSPVDMGAGNTATTTNIARLLQSLDSDGNPDNGITIPATAAATAATINFNVSENEFANDPAVINLVANSGSTTTTLISAEAANTHLNETLGNSAGGNQPDTSAFNVNVLMAGSPWYAIRNFESRGRIECGNKYTFGANSALTVVGKSQDDTQFDTTNGSYSFTTDGVLTLEGGDLGARVFVYQFNELTSERWTVNRSDNNDAGAYLEVAFSDRGNALQYASSLGGNCETDLSP